MPISGIQQQSSGFFHDLFAPLPEETAASVGAPKDGLDHLAGYMEKTSGSWDLFRVIDHGIQHFQNLPNLSDAVKDSASKVSKVTNLGGIALSVPTIFSDLNTVKQKTREFVTAQSRPYSDPSRHQRVMQAGKGAFLSTMWLTNTLAQAILFLNESKLINLAEYLPAVDGVYQGSSFISDSFELVQEAYKLDAYQNAQPRNEREAAANEEKKWLSWMVIIKDIASIAAAAIAIVGLAFGIAVFSIPIIASIGLGLSTVWLTMKISSYFYGEIIKERYADPVLIPI